MRGRIEARKERGLKSDLEVKKLRVTALLPHGLGADGGLYVDGLQVTWSVGAKL